MKDPKLLVLVPSSNRKFYLFRTPKNKEWHFKFTVPPWARGPRVPDIVSRSTGTRELAPARRIAAEQINSFFTRGDGGRTAEAMKLRNDYAKLHEIAKAYHDGARSICDKEELKAGTISGNIGALRTVVGRDRFEMATSTCLTSELVETFKRETLAPCLGDLVKLESRRRSINATLRQARSLFALDYMPLYNHLKLPDLTGFRAARGCKVDRQGTRYVPIAQGVIDAMDAEIRALRTTRPDMYLAFYFMLWLGLRPGEVREARLEWVEEWPTGARMAIIRRAYYRPKGISGAVGIAPSLLADIKELSGAVAALDYLIPAEHPTARRDMMRYEMSQFVRKHLGAGRQKTCHELRKHAISMQLMRTRNYVDALKFSRHSDVKTLQQHYGSFLDELQPITSSNWRDAA